MLSPLLILKDHFFARFSELFLVVVRDAIKFFGFVFKVLEAEVGGMSR